jgi:hypothetical protein
VNAPDLTVGPVVLAEPRVMAVSARHPFARRARAALADVARDTEFGVTGNAPGHGWDLHVPPRTFSGRPVLRGVDVATFQELLALIAAGQSVERYHARTDIAFVPLDDAPITEVAVVGRTQGLTARVRAFADAARDAVQADGGPAQYGTFRPADGPAPRSAAVRRPAAGGGDPSGAAGSRPRSRGRRPTRPVRHAPA